MARYKINQTDAELEIRVIETGPGGERLLAAFQDCQEGRCGCPTDEYEKVSTFSVEQDGADAIRVRLTPRPGERFDESEIEACLEHTVAEVSD